MRMELSRTKKNLTTTPILTIPDGSGGYVIYYDASVISVGSALMQHCKVIAYVSK